PRSWRRTPRLFPASGRSPTPPIGYSGTRLGADSRIRLKRAACLQNTRHSSSDRGPPPTRPTSSCLPAGDLETSTATPTSRSERDPPDEQVERGRISAPTPAPTDTFRQAQRPLDDSSNALCVPRRTSLSRLTRFPCKGVSAVGLTRRRLRSTTLPARERYKRA